MSEVTKIQFPARPTIAGLCAEVDELRLRFRQANLELVRVTDRENTVLRTIQEACARLEQLGITHGSIADRVAACILLLDEERAKRNKAEDKLAGTLSAMRLVVG